MKRALLSIAAVCAVLVAGVSLPAQASTYTVSCSTSGSITIANNEVTGHTSCAGEVAIPDSVTSIGNMGLAYSTAMTGVTFGPNSQLSTISGGAFIGSGLRRIAIPDSVTSIGNMAFQMATSLTNVDFGPNSRLTSIFPSAFYSATSLLSLAIPDSVTWIGMFAFSRTTSLSNVTFGPNSQLSSLGSGAFFQSSVSTVTFLGPEPGLGSNLWLDAPNGSQVLVSRAHVGSGAGKFGNVGSTWNGLVVEVPVSTLTLNAGASVDAQALEFGAIPARPAASRTGFTLGGWSATENGPAAYSSDLSDFIMGHVPTTLFAVWSAIPEPTKSSEVEASGVQFGGPLIQLLDKRELPSETPAALTIIGKRLHNITRVTLNGVEIQIGVKSRTHMTLLISPIAAGRYTLVVHSRHGKITLSRVLTVR